MMKNKKLYKKGFTLVEMVVTITILGVVSLIALPIISNITSNFSKEKTNMCISSIESSFKLYMDNKAEDEFGSQTLGCVEYSYEDAIKDGMVEISDKELEECRLKKDKIRLRVRKTNDVFNYEIYNLDDSDSVTKHDDSTCNMDVDHAGPGVFFTPDGLPNPKQNADVMVMIKDDYGFAPNQEIKYQWFKAGTEEAVSNAKTRRFSNKIMYGSSSLSFNVSSPAGLDGDYELAIFPVHLMDTVGNSTTDTIRSHIFKFDNTKPNIVIKMHSVKSDNTKGDYISTHTNEDVLKDNWYKDGYYVDVLESNDSSGIKSFTWRENPKDNFSSLNVNLGEAHTYDHLENFLFHDTGKRFATVTVVDNADNSRTQTITANIATTYQIKFDANGGSGGPTSLTKIHGIDTNLPGEKPSKDGYTFAGWHTSKNVNKDTSIAYNSGSKFSQNKEMTLYAVWKKTITVNFERNRVNWQSFNSKTCDLFNDDTSCSITSPNINNIGYSNEYGTPFSTFIGVDGWDTDSNATSGKWAAGTSKSFSSNATYYAVAILRLRNYDFRVTVSDGLRHRDWPGAGYKGTLMSGSTYRSYDDHFAFYYDGGGGDFALWIKGYISSGTCRHGDYNNEPSWNCIGGWSSAYFLHV